jgi:hypothetical protein
MRFLGTFVTSADRFPPTMGSIAPEGSGTTVQPVTCWPPVTKSEPPEREVGSRKELDDNSIWLPDAQSVAGESPVSGIVPEEMVRLPSESLKLERDPVERMTSPV